MTDQLLALYHSGAYIPLGIVLASLALGYASTHFAWLEVPNRKHYVSAALAGLATLVPPALQGTTPNISMIVSAVAVVAALLLPGLSKPEVAS